MAIIDLSITVASSTIAARVVDALAAKWGFNVTDGITKQQFIRRYLIKEIRDGMKQVESSDDIRTVIQQKNGEVEALIIT